MCVCELLPVHADLTTRIERVAHRGQTMLAVCLQVDGNGGKFATHNSRRKILRCHVPLPMSSHILSMECTYSVRCGRLLSLIGNWEHVQAPFLHARAKPGWKPISTSNGDSFASVAKLLYALTFVCTNIGHDAGPMAWALIRSNALRNRYGRSTAFALWLGRMPPPSLRFSFSLE